MFDKIPPRVWCLLTIAVIAYAPTVYIYRHITGSLSGEVRSHRDDDLSWRSQAQLLRSLAILIGLIGLAIFIYTPTAVRLVRSPNFLPIILAAFGAWSIYTAPRDIIRGSVQPHVKGFYSTYKRATQPKRFWASVTWNALLGCMFLWLAVVTINEAATDQCYDRRDTLKPQDVITACSKLIAEQGESGKDLADLIAARGYAYDRMGDLVHALDDYSKAISLDPNDSYSLYNRALIRDRVDEYDNALSDYSASLKLRPDNFGGYMKRGILLGKMGRLPDAKADFDRAHEMQPKDMDVLALRGIAYAGMRDRVRAEQDFNTVLKTDPANKLAKEGQALLKRSDVDLPRRF